MERAPTYGARRPGEDLFGGNLPDPLGRVRVFYSGANDYRDALGVVRAAAAVCVSATEVAQRTLDLLAWYLASERTAHVFVDSGAFAAFQAERRLDFRRRVYPVYERIMSALDACHDNPFCDRLEPPIDADVRRRLWLAAPDVVGDARASRRLLERHAPILRPWMDRGFSLLVPLQRGEGRWSAAASYAAACDVLGTDDFVVGVPSRAEAFSAADLEQFLRQAQPARLHLLGLGRDRSAWLARLPILDRWLPRASLSCDANRFRVFLGKGRALTDQVAERVAAERGWESAPAVPLAELGGFHPHDYDIDETEVMGDLYSMACSFSQGELRQLADLVGLREEAVLEAAAAGTLGDYLDENLIDPRLLDMAVWRMCRATTPSEARVEVITGLIKAGKM